MTNAFSSMEYPHWLIIAGAVLLMLGFVGLALRQRGVEAEPTTWRVGNDQGWSESEAELAQTEGDDRKAKLEEQKKDRWANKDRGTTNRGTIDQKFMARNRNDRLDLRRYDQAGWRQGSPQGVRKFRRRGNLV